jgi:hypothetical protein
MATTPAPEKKRGTGLFRKFGDFYAGLWGLRYKPDPPPFDPSPRPPGWAGHWSEAYGRLLAYTFTEDPPFSKPAREVISNAPRPLQEAIEPLAGSAGLIDRNGRALPWQWSRSLTADLLGPAGVALAFLCLATAVAGVTISLLKLPPLMDDAPPPPASKAIPSDVAPAVTPLLMEPQPMGQSKTPVEKAPGQFNKERKSDAPGSQKPVQKSPPSPPTGKPRS